MKANINGRNHKETKTMTIYTPKEPIKSHSHNARCSIELGYHWPTDEKFKLLKTRHYHCANINNIHLQQIDGEEVIICMRRNQLPILFNAI